MLQRLPVGGKHMALAPCLGRYAWVHTPLTDLALTMLAISNTADMPHRSPQHDLAIFSGLRFTPGPFDLPHVAAMEAAQSESIGTGFSLGPICTTYISCTTYHNGRVGSR